MGRNQNILQVVRADGCSENLKLVWEK